MNILWPNHALQRLEWSGETVKGILLHRMKRKAEGRVCRAAHESTAPRHERRGCNGFVRAHSLSPAGLLPAVEFLSPFPKRLKCGIPRAGSLSLDR